MFLVLTAAWYLGRFVTAPPVHPSNPSLSVRRAAVSVAMRGIDVL